MRLKPAVIILLAIIFITIGCATVPEEAGDEKITLLPEETVAQVLIPEEVRVEQNNLRSDVAIVRGKAAHRLAKNPGTAQYLIPDIIMLLDDTTPLMFYRDNIITVEEAPKSGYYPGPRRTNPQKIATETLVKLGPIAVADLNRALLQDPNAGIRSRSAEILGLIGDKLALWPLMESLMRGPTSDVQAASAAALGRLADRRALEALRYRLNDNSAAVRKAAGQAISAIDPSRTYSVQMELLQDKDQTVRSEAARQLGDTGNEDAVPLLVEKYNNSNMGFQSDEKAAAEVIRALGKLGDPRGYDAILPALEHPSSYKIRVEAVNAAQRIGLTPLAREKIRTLIDDRHPGVGRAATKALAENGDAEDLDVLIEAMSSNNEKVRYWAAHGLGNIGDPRGIKPILDALPVQNSFLRNNYVKALRILTGEDLDRFSYDWLDRIREEYISE